MLDVLTRALRWQPCTAIRDETAWPSAPPPPRPRLAQRHGCRRGAHNLENPPTPTSKGWTHE